METGANQETQVAHPKGNKHLSTWIQELLHDEDFKTHVLDGNNNRQEYKGAPIKAMIRVAYIRSITDEKNGVKWADWLAKYGYGSKLDITSKGKSLAEGKLTEDEYKPSRRDF